MKTESEGLDAGRLTLGFLLGLLMGGIIALFLSPRSGAETREQIADAGQELRGQLEEAVTLSDPVAESIAEGKAAARRRRSELGFDE